MTFQNFMFRPDSVDGCFHDAERGETIVHYHGYTDIIPDPERRLFDLLTIAVNPTPLE